MVLLYRTNSINVAEKIMAQSSNADIRVGPEWSESDLRRFHLTAQEMREYARGLNKQAREFYQLQSAATPDKKIHYISTIGMLLEAIDAALARADVIDPYDSEGNYKTKWSAG